MSGHITSTEMGRLALLLRTIQVAGRVLVTGSRRWTDRLTVESALSLVELRAGAASLVLVHGDCPEGLDRIAASVVDGREGWTVEPHPADWDRYGRRAGPIRNSQMVSAGASLCLAFVVDGSPGASDCASRAERAGIPTWRCER